MSCPDKGLKRKEGPTCSDQRDQVTEGQSALRSVWSVLGKQSEWLELRWRKAGLLPRVRPGTFRWAAHLLRFLPGRTKGVGGQL